jgi:ParB/RepB/Spo0J family partition protein
MPQRNTTQDRTIGVKSIATAELKPNPHNPRLLFDREPLETLKRSIAKVGILVPLTVYRAAKDQKYTILDGQRRWMCAEAVGLRKVPVNEVQEPSLVENIVTMFQIHKLREDWELMPTALKLELLMNHLKEHRDKQIADLTGLDQAVVVRCKKLLSYPAKYQEMMLDRDPEKRRKADFFIELYAVRNDRTVNKFPWFQKDRFTRQMLGKYENPRSDLKAVTDFRKIKQYVTIAAKAGKSFAISTRLREYSEDDALPLAHLAIDVAAVSAGARRLLKSANKLKLQIESINAEQYFGEIALWGALESLSNTIQTKLKEADRRSKRAET